MGVAKMPQTPRGFEIGEQTAHGNEGFQNQPNPKGV
jgi:hypothetical protein